MTGKDGNCVWHTYVIALTLIIAPISSRNVTEEQQDYAATDAPIRVLARTSWYVSNCVDCIVDSVSSSSGPNMSRADSMIHSDS